MTPRTIAAIIPALQTSDGAGVRLRRSLGQSAAARLDPFLMLDEFSSDRPDDYLAGFPEHPHRGFETLTYLIDGHMLHSDHLGHRGDLKSGGVQWMRAGRGIVHSEMPQQENGLLRGFQLWVNLPARVKMSAPAYRDIAAAEITQIALGNGGTIKLIAGEMEQGGQRYSGPLTELHQRVLVADLQLPPQGEFVQRLPESFNALVYVFEGAAQMGAQGLRRNEAAILGGGEGMQLRAGENGLRLLLLAGEPIGEPVAQIGPFVMNTESEVRQALQDWRSGRLLAAKV